MQLHRNFGAFFALLFVPAGAAYGQSTFATITGSVFDSTGGALPGVEITATHKQLGLTFTTQSNETGVYTLPELREGEYRLRAVKSGFKEFSADNVVLESRSVRRLDLRMELGAVQEHIEVVAEAGAIETERAVIASTRTQRELNNMPISANSLYYMFMTLPMTQPRGSSPSFAGTRNDQYQMSVDGASINAGTGGVISNLAGQTETFKEMKVEMVNNTAEHAGLGHVLLVTKSGENELHGSVFYNYQSPGLRAREFFATDRASGIDHEYGFAVGGPVVLPRVYNGRNRTFWHVSADTDGASQLREELTPTVPLDAWRRGDFSALGLQIRNPLTGEVYADGRIPASAINAVSRKIQERFWPLPNVGDPNTFTNRNHLSVMRGKDSKEWHGTAKLDRRFTDRDYTYASFQVHQVDVNDWDGSLPAFSWKNWKRLTKSVALGYSHTFSANLINELRFAHAFNSYPRRGFMEGSEVVSSLGLQGLNPDLPEGGGVFKVSFSGIGITSITQTDQLRPGNVNNNTNIHDDISYFRGRHNIKAGVQLGIVGFDNQTLGSATFGSVSFANTFSKVPGVSRSGHQYADFLFGVPTSANRGAPSPLEARRRNSYAFYLQDDWKTTSRITLNLGLRYEYHAPWHEQSGLMAMFDRFNGRVVVTDEGMSHISPFMPAGYVDIVSASSAGLPASTLVYGDKNNFGPRVSLALRPFSDNRTVIRTGYGIFYDMTSYRPSTAGAPFVVDEPSFTNPSTPLVVFPWVFPAASTGKQPTMSLPSGINTHITMPYTQQWSFTVDHERWGTGFSASYVGTATRQMWWSRDLNAPAPDGRLYIEKPRPFPKYPSISLTENGGNHTYQALSLRAARKVRSGLQFNAAYTWARDLGDDADPEDPFNRSRERGPDSILPNQRLNVMVLYNLPFGRGQKYFGAASRAVDKAIGGWELSVITYQQTGQHLTPSISVPDPLGIRYTSTATRPTISIRPDVYRDPNLDNPAPGQWYDLSAFGAPPVGRLGSAARGIVNGPGVNVFHAAVHKTVRFSESPKSPVFKLGLVATNAFNHTNFANPSMTVSSLGTAAKISGTGGPNSSNPGDRAGARQMFFRMRVEW